VIARISSVACCTAILFASGCTERAATQSRAVKAPETVPSTPSVPELDAADVVVADADERAIEVLPLGGPITESWLEISGMAWFGDYLVLLPETLSLHTAVDKHLIPGEQLFYVLTRKEIMDSVEGRTDEPLVPRAIPVYPKVDERLAGIDGLEAIAFHGDSVFIQVETYQNDDGTNPSVLVRGRIAPDASSIMMYPNNAKAYARPTTDRNASHEAMFVWEDRVYSIYELNSAALMPSAAANAFELNLDQAGFVPFPAIDYRITDVTQPDAEGYFWAINFRYPGSGRESEKAEGCEALIKRFGVGPSHRRFEQVERLVQLQITESAIVLTDRPPIQLELLHDWKQGGARNWEGIVRLEGVGFLIITDRFPSTILALVREPNP
jgi:hypothetical protein